MLKIFLVTMFLAQGIFAQQVEVQVDGQRYYCSQDPNNSSSLNCETGLKIVTEKFTTCYKSSSTEVCTKVISRDVKRYRDCLEVIKYCYNSCYKGASGEFCSNQCYN